ncbi:MAG: hypothetical protein JWO19_3014, partial [Bryobacterales bacterium]|nr:hypothetical protein [Bryobacterales bacterium]
MTRHLARSAGNLVPVAVVLLASSLACYP